MQLKINKLANKTFIVCNVIIILLFLLIYLIIPAQFDKYISREKESSLKQLNQMLSEHSKLYLNYSHTYSYGIAEGKSYDVISEMVKIELLRYFQINPDFIYYALIPKRGGQSIDPLIYNTEKIGDVKDLFIYETDKTTMIKKAGMLNVITPIFSKDDVGHTEKVKLGYLVSGFSLKDQEDELKKIEHAIYVICGFFILFGNLLGYILYRHIAIPLKESTELVKNVVQGDLMGIVKYKSKDELGSLTHALNTMVKTWRQKVEKIKNVIEVCRNYCRVCL